jgi:sarcosine oxidase
MHDVIVVGLGGMGSAVACHLARRGLRVLALERFGIAHEMGSSHGLTRIIRLAYFEHPSYVPLLRRAFALWRELEAASGERLLHVTGALDIGAEGSRILDGSKRSCEVHDLPHEVLESAAVTKRFPAFRLPPSLHAVFQPDGGFLLPERCIDAHVRLAIAHGAGIRNESRVVGWEPDGPGVVVRTTDAEHRASQLVICAGAWTASLVPSLAPLLRPERQVLGWLGVTRPERFTPGRFPVFVMEAEEGHFYGFTSFATDGFKLGKYHHHGETVDPETIDRNVRPEDEETLRAFARRYFPDGSGPARMAKVCMFTNTTDEHFIVDRLPGVPQVLVVSACSGHGFKFCSVIGEIAADLIQHGATHHDISLHRLARFPGLA